MIFAMQYLLLILWTLGRNSIRPVKTENAYKDDLIGARYKWFACVLESQLSPSLFPSSLAAAKHWTFWTSVCPGILAI